MSLLRVQDEKKQAQIAEWTKLGVKPVKGDPSSPASLIEALKGIDIVISCLSRDGLFTGGEIELIRAAKQVGVKRFVPSQFGNDMHDFELGQNPFIDAKVRSLQELKKVDLDYVLVSCNTWLEFSIGSPFIGFNIVGSDSVIVTNDGNGYESHTINSLRTFSLICVLS